MGFDREMASNLSNIILSFISRMGNEDQKYTINVLAPYPLFTTLQINFSELESNQSFQSWPPQKVLRNRIQHEHWAREKRQTVLNNG